MPSPPSHIDIQAWGLLVLLSLIWSCSYLFIGIAVQSLSPMLIVMSRIVLAALALLPVHVLLIGGLPRDRATWWAIIGMSIFNNVIPFMLIVTGQTMITAGLASVINATSPMFGVAFIAAAGLEPLILRKVIGIAIGIVGVAILKGATLMGQGSQSIGILLCLAAAASYGLGSLWARRMIRGAAPLSMATGQLLVSSAIMLVLAFSFDHPVRLLHAPWLGWLAILVLALACTSLAYIIYFRIVARAGAANVLLATMMIPPCAIALGVAFLGEDIHLREIIGAAVIVFALIIIDGRALRLFRPRENAA